MDLAAYPVPHIEEYNKLVKHAGHKEVTWQVLVQPAGAKTVTDVTQLVGKTVYVEKDSNIITGFRILIRNSEEELTLFPSARIHSLPKILSAWSTREKSL